MTTVDHAPGGVTASGDLIFAFMHGPAARRRRRLAIDNVVVNNTATTTTSTTVVDLVDTGWTATYTENGTPVSIADADSSIFDADSTNMSSATVTLTNPQAGDRLLMNFSSAASGTLASGIAWTRTDTQVTFSGSFSKASYADAIELVQFENTGNDPSTTQRVINVTVNDGTSNSNTAVTLIDVVPVNDEPTLTATASNPTYTEDGAAVSVFSGAAASTIEAGQTLTRLDLTVSNLSNGAAERLRVDGTTIALVNGATGTTATNGMSLYRVGGRQHRDRQRHQRRGHLVRRGADPGQRSRVRQHQPGADRRQPRGDHHPPRRQRQQHGAERQHGGARARLHRDGRGGQRRSGRERRRGIDQRGHAAGDRRQRADRQRHRRGRRLPHRHVLSAARWTGR